MRSVSRRATCKPSASGVERRGSSAEEALHRGLRRRSRSVAVAHAVMSKARQLEIERVRTAAFGDRQQVVDLQQMGMRCSDARRADCDNSSVLRRVARCGAGQPQECGAAAGIGGGCGQNRGLCAPLPRLTRRAVRRQGTRRVPAPAPEWRPVRPARRRHGSQPVRCRPRTAAPQQRRARPMERHLRGRRLTVQRALTDSVEQRWPTSRPGSAFRQRRCHPAAPEYRRLRAEPERPGPRQGAYSSAPAAVMRPRCPRVAAAAARYRRRAGRAGPPPRAPGAPPGRPTTCAGRGATTDPSAGAVPGRTSGQCSPSRCSGRAPRRAVCRAVAPPRERWRPAGRRLGGCSCRRPARSARAGVAGAAAGRPTTGRVTAPQTDHPGTIPACAKRHSATPMEPRPARARAPAYRWRYVFWSGAVVR